MQERFQSVLERLQGDAVTDMDRQNFVKSWCGSFGRPTWNGTPVLKSAFELVIYPMLLAELRPASVIELGAGPGGSGAFFADQARALGIQSRIISFDIRDQRSVRHPAVEFCLQDIRDHDGVRRILRDLPRPWLVVEDCHATVYETLTLLDSILTVGDYMVVEDSGPFNGGPIKREAMRRFAVECGDRYRVDSKYTDFFGRNVTSAVDSIFRRVS